MIKFFDNRQPKHLKAKAILDVLDASADAFAFPMLDNGYVYLAASRLSLFRSDHHWAVVFEIFGYSPRSGTPDLSIVTISSDLRDRNPASDYASQDAYENYLRSNPQWDTRYFYPITNDDWISSDDQEIVEPSAAIILRGQRIEVPDTKSYAANGIALENQQPLVFELCRYLANLDTNAVLATETERRVSIAPDMKQIMVFDSWHHPDLAGGQRPSQTETFQKIAAALEKNSPDPYTPVEPSNTHWQNWPDGGTL